MMSMYCKYCSTTIMEDDINYCPEHRNLSIKDTRIKELEKINLKLRKERAKTRHDVFGDNITHDKWGEIK